MKVFKANQVFTKNLHDAVCHAFNFDFNSANFQIRNIGNSDYQILEIFNGENAGKYDIHLDHDENYYYFILAD